MPLPVRPKARGPVRRYLEHKEPAVRLAATQTMACTALEKEEAARLVSRLTADIDREVRREAYRTLVVIFPQALSSDTHLRWYLWHEALSLCTIPALRSKDPTVVCDGLRFVTTHMNGGLDKGLLPMELGVYLQALTRHENKEIGQTAAMLLECVGWKASNFPANLRLPKGMSFPSKKRDEPIPASELRTWATRDGRSLGEARLRGFSGAKRAEVSLEAPDGTEIRMTWDEMSQEDMDWYYSIP